MPAFCRNDTPSSSRIVFVHGAGGGGWEWDIWARMFAARGLHARAPNLMPADSGLASTTFDDYLAQVLAWCRGDARQAPGRPILIGASLGGLLALSAATRIQAAALLLINPLPPSGIGDARESTYPNIIPWRSERSVSSTVRAMPDADDAARLFAWRRWRDESGLALGQAQRGVDVELPNCPMLVMASENDEDVSPATTRELARLCSADFVCLQDSSHVGPLLGRQAARAAEQTLDWLARLNLIDI